MLEQPSKISRGGGMSLSGSEVHKDLDDALSALLVSQHFCSTDSPLARTDAAVLPSAMSVAVPEGSVMTIGAQKKLANVSVVEINNGIQALLSRSSGIRLDLGCSDHKPEGWVGIDLRALPGVDIVHDLEDVPYPLPDACCQLILASHIIEHLRPQRMLAIMDELWRLLLPHGQLMIAMPYGVSPRFLQDPTHVNPWTEVTPLYWDPDCAELYKVYRPKPWKVEERQWDHVGDLHIRMAKR